MRPGGRGKRGGRDLRGVRDLATYTLRGPCHTLQAHFVHLCVRYTILIDASAVIVTAVRDYRAWMNASECIQRNGTYLVLQAIPSWYRQKALKLAISYRNAD